jgi:cell division protein FtsI (penicillin-binding protein 3)
MSMSRTNRRLALFMGLAVLFLVALFARTFYVQVIAAPALQEKAVDQNTRVVELSAARGVIYDRNGQALAISETMATIYANPHNIVNAATTAAELAPVLGLPEEGILEKLSSDVSFRYLARKIDPAVGERVKALELDGIGVIAEDMRVYPKGALASQLLGFVGGDEYTGIAGLELQYNEQLSGKPGEMQVISDPKSGNRIAMVSRQQARPGQSITLTIDEQIQFEAERVLASVVEEFQAKKAFAVVIDPSTGEILAMVNTPIFDANDYASDAIAEVDRRNSVVTDQYEPGSTFKMVVTAAALEAGLVKPDTVFTLGPEIAVYDRVVHEAHANVPAVRHLTVTQILAESSNVGAVTLGLEVGKTRLVEMIDKMGFTEKLGIDFPGEAPGEMLAPAKWSGTTIANVPIGQGIAASPLQLAAAYAAIANDGVLVQPHLARDLVQPWSRNVVSPVVAAQLRGMLKVTVSDGTGSRAAVEGYEVAGKTGTAQKVNDEGGYAEDRFVASFVGMVPAEDPQLVIMVMVDEPSTEHLGAYVAAPAFAKIAKFALQRLGIPPTSAGAGATASEGSAGSTAVH